MNHILKPLPVSEEMLGAYIEGNLSLAESSMIKSIIDSDDMFRDFVNDLLIPDPIAVEPGDEGLLTLDADFMLPEIPISPESQYNDICYNTITDGIIIEHSESLDFSPNLLSNDDEQHILDVDRSMFEDGDYNTFSDDGNDCLDDYTDF